MRVRDMTIGEWIERCAFNGVSHNCSTCEYDGLCEYIEPLYDIVEVPSVVTDKYLSRNNYPRNNRSRDAIVQSLDTTLEKYNSTEDERLKHVYRMITFEILGIGLKSEQITSSEYQYYMEGVRKR